MADINVIVWMSEESWRGSERQNNGLMIGHLFHLAKPNPDYLILNG